MSSNALLVTKRTPEPDLYRVFGPDCPVPMYDSLDELEAICAHYLAHEDERRAVVAACNALVTPDFSFRSRCLDYLRLAGVTYQPPSGAPAARKDVRVLTDQEFA
jgi:spore maturation protein CgeB